MIGAPDPALRLAFATTADLGQILALEQRCETATHWAFSTYAAMLQAPPESGPKRCLVVARRGEVVAGFAVGMALKAGGDAEVESVVVSESARRVGIGRALCIAVLEWCREQGASAVALEVRAKSEGAIALYSGLGFRQVGRRPNYYREPEDDALIFILRLGSRAESD